MARLFKGILNGGLAGPGYVILNIIRAINIIVFLDTIAAGVVMLIKITLNNNYFFFEAVSHAITIIISSKSFQRLHPCQRLILSHRKLTYNPVFLIVTELPVFENFFNRHVPQLGKTASFVPLSLIMMIMGVSLLGNLNNNDYSVDAMGLPFWRIVASAGILAMTMGILNFMAVRISFPTIL